MLVARVYNPRIRQLDIARIRASHRTAIDTICQNAKTNIVAIIYAVASSDDVVGIT